ncbi:MAG: IS200/IS605 family element transposase accessory protein TnpB [Acidobacteria bacterium]|nr:IS200/IS605 family element transposase accessory protein TnpB [Acidobacteriota bacterium]
MPTLTIKAKIECDAETEAILRDAMASATKVYNGLLWHLRREYETTGITKLSRSHLNAILKTLPRASAYYSLSVQATRNEVIEAYHSFFALRRAGLAQHNAPGFRRKDTLSPLRYYDGYGFSLDGDTLTLSLGTKREDKIRSVCVGLKMRPDASYKRIANVLITYDAKLGLMAHLVVEAEPLSALGDDVAAVDLGETQAMAVALMSGRVLLYSGRLVKSVRRYWQKVRARVKPPTQTNRKKSRRYSGIDRKESAQVNHLLHILTTDCIRRLWDAGVSVIVVGDLKYIREQIDYGRQMNQRLHSWPFRKIVFMLTYKALLHGMTVVEADESYTSQTCHACGLVKKPNRQSRGLYICRCGWRVQADANSALNQYERYAHVSPVKRSSGSVAEPVVVPLRLDWHMVYEPASHTGCPSIH